MSQLGPQTPIMVWFDITGILSIFSCNIKIPYDAFIWSAAIMTNGRNNKRERERERSTECESNKHEIVCNGTSEVHWMCGHANVRTCGRTSTFILDSYHWIHSEQKWVRAEIETCLVVFLLNQTIGTIGINCCWLCNNRCYGRFWLTTMWIENFPRVVINFVITGVLQKIIKYRCIFVEEYDTTIRWHMTPFDDAPILHHTPCEVAGTSTTIASWFDCVS